MNYSQATDDQDSPYQYPQGKAFSKFGLNQDIAPLLHDLNTFGHPFLEEQTTSVSFDSEGYYLRLKAYQGLLATWASPPQPAMNNANPSRIGPPGAVKNRRNIHQFTQHLVANNNRHQLVLAITIAVDLFHFTQKKNKDEKLNELAAKIISSINKLLAPSANGNGRLNFKNQDLLIIRQKILQQKEKPFYQLTLKLWLETLKLLHQNHAQSILPLAPTREHKKANEQETESGEIAWEKIITTLGLTLNQHPQQTKHSANLSTSSVTSEENPKPSAPHLVEHKTHEEKLTLDQSKSLNNLIDIKQEITGIVNKKWFKRVRLKDTKASCQLIGAKTLVQDCIQSNNISTLQIICAKAYLQFMQYDFHSQYRLVKGRANSRKKQLTDIYHELETILSKNTKNFEGCTHLIKKINEVIKAINEKNSQLRQCLSDLKDTLLLYVEHREKQKDNQVKAANKLAVASLLKLMTTCNKAEEKHSESSSLLSTLKENNKGFQLLENLLSQPSNDKTSTPKDSQEAQEAYILLKQCHQAGYSQNLLTSALLQRFLVHLSKDQGERLSHIRINAWNLYGEIVLEQVNYIVAHGLSQLQKGTTEKIQTICDKLQKITTCAEYARLPNKKKIDSTIICFHHEVLSHEIKELETEFTILKNFRCDDPHLSEERKSDQENPLFQTLQSESLAIGKNFDAPQFRKSLSRFKSGIIYSTAINESKYKQLATLLEKYLENITLTSDALLKYQQEDSTILQVNQLKEILINTLNVFRDILLIPTTPSAIPSDLQSIQNEKLQVLFKYYLFSLFALNTNRAIAEIRIFYENNGKVFKFNKKDQNPLLGKEAIANLILDYLEKNAEKHTLDEVSSIFNLYIEIHPTATKDLSGSIQIPSRYQRFIGIRNSYYWRVVFAYFNKGKDGGISCESIIKNLKVFYADSSKQFVAIDFLVLTIKNILDKKKPTGPNRNSPIGLNQIKTLTQDFIENFDFSLSLPNTLRAHINILLQDLLNFMKASVENSEQADLDYCFFQLVKAQSEAHLGIELIYRCLAHLSQAAKSNKSHGNEFHSYSVDNQFGNDDLQQLVPEVVKVYLAHRLDSLYQSAPWLIDAIDCLRKLVGIATPQSQRASTTNELVSQFNQCLQANNLRNCLEYNKIADEFFTKIPRLLDDALAAEDGKTFQSPIILIQELSTAFPNAVRYKTPKGANEEKQQKTSPLTDSPPETSHATSLKNKIIQLLNHLHEHIRNRNFSIFEFNDNTEEQPSTFALTALDSLFKAISLGPQINNPLEVHVNKITQTIFSHILEILKHYQQNSDTYFDKLKNHKKELELYADLLLQAANILSDKEAITTYLSLIKILDFIIDFLSPQQPSTLIGRLQKRLQKKSDNLLANKTTELLNNFSNDDTTPKKKTNAESGELNLQALLSTITMSIFNNLKIIKTHYQTRSDDYFKNLEIHAHELNLYTDLLDLIKGYDNVCKNIILQLLALIKMLTSIIKFLSIFVNTRQTNFALKTLPPTGIGDNLPDDIVQLLDSTKGHLTLDAHKTPENEFKLMNKKFSKDQFLIFCCYCAIIRACGLISYTNDTNDSQQADDEQKNTDQFGTIRGIGSAIQEISYITQQATKLYQETISSSSSSDNKLLRFKEKLLTSTNRFFSNSSDCKQAFDQLARSLSTISTPNQ